LLKLISSPEQRKLGDDKRDSLTQQCQRCEVRPLCNGGCPKERFVLSRQGDPRQNYLCAGLELVFTHTRPAMRTMAQLFQQDHPPSGVMALTAAEDTKRRRNQPCPCGSGQRFRSCHGNNAPQSAFSRLSPATNKPQDGSAMSVPAKSPLQTGSGLAQGATM
jgi:uncharacterized protein